MREQSELDERAGVEEKVEALAHCQLAALVLLGNLRLAAHGEVLLAFGVQLADPCRVLVRHRANSARGLPPRRLRRRPPRPAER